MTTSCRDFRALLELVLDGRAVERALSELAWHKHLLACGECRNLLEAEEALEILLATLPEPKLPDDLARRVVLRLRDARKQESRLDALLELDRAARAPDRLAESVLARLRPERDRSAESVLASADRRLDRLLDLDRDVETPGGLADRVLAGLRAERTLARPSTAREISTTADHALAPRSVARADERAAADVARAGARAPVVVAPAGARAPVVVARAGARAAAVREIASGASSQRSRSRWLYAAAAGILATLAGWALWQRALDNTSVSSQNIAQGGAPSALPDRRAHDPRSSDKLAQRDAGAAPEAGMLSALDVLEQWDLLKSDDVDVLLSSSIDAADEALLEYQDAAPAAPTFKEKEPEPRSKG